MSFFRLVTHCVLLSGLLVAVSAQRDYSQQQTGYDSSANTYERTNSYEAAPLFNEFQGSSVSSGNQVQTVAVSGDQKPRVHTIHTTSEREVIRVEEFKRPKQIIRIHEQPAPPPEIIRVQAPPEPQKVIRVVQRSRPVRVQLAHQPEVQEVTIPIRQVVQRVRPVVYQQHVETTPVVQTVVAHHAPVARHVVAAAPVVQVQRVHAAPVATSFQTYSTPVQHVHSIQAAPVVQQIQSNAVRYQTFSAQPVQSRSFVYNSAPSFVSGPSFSQSYPYRRS